MNSGPERRRGRPFPIDRGYVGAFPSGPPLVPYEVAKMLLKRPDEIHNEIKKILAERAALLEQAAIPEEQIPPPEVENKKPSTPEEQPPPVKEARSYGLAFTGAFPGGPGLLPPEFVREILKDPEKVRREFATRLRARFQK